MDHFVDYCTRKYGQPPTVEEWLDFAFLGDYKKPLTAEVLMQIPEELQSQIPNLPPEFGCQDYHVEA